MIVVHGIMPGGSVVPECDRSGGPVITVSMLRARDVSIKHVKEWSTFFVIPAFNTHRKRRIDVERFAVADGVTNDQRVYGVLYCSISVAEPFGQPWPVLIILRVIATKDVST